jgi:NAD(P)-dependent dehydrogenase (short-subunit alcohol dehydrogenase family)
VVTGAGSGIGLAAARSLAALGARVVPVGRNQQRADDAAAPVLEAGPGADVEPLACDVSSLAELRAFAARSAAEHDRLDVLVNNAGVMPDERTRSATGSS